MRCWAEWYGGSSYAAPKTWEAFASQAEAVRVFRARLENRDGRTPAVDDSATMLLYFHKPVTGDYPARVVRVGPRGGVRVEDA